MHFRQLSFHVLNVNVIRASHLSNISMRHFFFSHRTYFDNIVAIDSLLEHIMVSVISASMCSFTLSSRLHILGVCVRFCVFNAAVIQVHKGPLLIFPENTCLLVLIIYNNSSNTTYDNYCNYLLSV